MAPKKGSGKNAAAKKGNKAEKVAPSEEIKAKVGAAETEPAAPSQPAEPTITPAAEPAETANGAAIQPPETVGEPAIEAAETADETPVPANDDFSGDDSSDVEAGGELGKVENITGDGLVTKKVAQKGAGWESPKELAKVTVKYQCRIGDSQGAVIEGGDGTQEFEFDMGIPDSIAKVCEGAELAFAKMKKGEKAELTIDKEYTGSQTPLFIQVELVSFENPKETWQLKGAQDKVERGTVLKTIGNAAFKLNQARRAKLKYEAALKIFEHEKDFKGDDKKIVDELKLSCYGNVAACALKTKEWQAVISNSSKALEIDPNNAKSVLRRGQANAQIGETDDALADLKRAKELFANDQPTLATIAKIEGPLRKQIQALKDKQKQLFGGFFEKVTLVSKAEEHANAVKAATKKAAEMDAEDSDSSDPSEHEDEGDSKPDGEAAASSGVNAEEGEGPPPLEEIPSTEQ